MKRILAVMIAMIILTLVGCKQEEGNKQGVVSSPLGVAPTTIDGTPLTPEQIAQLTIKFKDRPPEAKFDEKNLVLIKALIRYKNLRASAEPGGVENGRELQYFRSYYVFEEKTVGSNLYYQLGTTPWRNDIVGWVSARYVQLWPTKVGYRLKEGAPKIYIYASRDDVIKSIKGEPVEPIAETFYRYDYKPFMAWPVISGERDQNRFVHNDRTFEIAEIALLGCRDLVNGSTQEVSAPNIRLASSELTEKQHQILSRVRMLDVVFCIDTTESMKPYIEQAKEAVRVITTALKNSEYQPDLAFGLVEYRDFVDGLYFTDNGQKKVTRLYPLTNNVGKFLADIAHVDEGKTSSVDWSEAGFEGVKVALTEMNWRGGGLSERILILIGDNSAHDPECKACTTRSIRPSTHPHDLTSSQLIDIATQKLTHVRIYSLLAPNRCPVEAERNRHQAQFSQLAQATGGKCFTLQEASKVVVNVNEVVFGEGLPRVEVKEDVTREILELRPLTTMDSPEAKKTPETWEEVMETLDDPQKVMVVKLFIDVGIPLKDLLPGQTVFTTGWVCTESAGAEVLEREVYMTKKALSGLITNLDHVSQVLRDPRAVLPLYRMVSEVREEGETPLFLFDANDIPMDAWLDANYLHHGPHSILSFDKTSLWSMPERQRFDIANKLVEDYIPALTLERRDKDRFPSPKPSDPGWVREKFVP